MKQRRNRNPIPERSWLELEKRDPILEEIEIAKGRIENISNSWFQNKEIQEAILAGYEKELKFWEAFGSTRTWVQKIPDKVLESHRIYSDYSMIVKKYIDICNLTLDEIADCFGVSHTTISNSFFHETPKGKARNEPKISRDFLAAYSLLFRVSPTHLCGFTTKYDFYRLKIFSDKEFCRNKPYFKWEKPEKRCTKFRFRIKHLFIPKWRNDTKVSELAVHSKKFEIIKEFVYDLANDKSVCDSNGYLLKIIVIICNAKQSARNEIKKVLFSIPCIARNFYCKDDYSVQYTSDLVKKSRRLEIPTSYNDLIYALSQLDIKDADLIEILIQFSKLDESAKKSTYFFLKDCGFFSVPQAFFNKWQCYEDEAHVLCVKRRYSSRNGRHSKS